MPEDPAQADKPVKVELPPPGISKLVNLGPVAVSVDLDGRSKRTPVLVLETDTFEAAYTFLKENPGTTPSTERELFFWIFGSASTRHCCFWTF